jgi:hypothetical protein
MDRRVRLNVLAAGVAIAFSLYLVGGLVFSGFSILDDHNILEWLGSDNKLHASEIWPTLMGTEVGHFAHSARYRPAYYGQMVFEAWLWGDNPVGYHVVQVVAFGLFLWSIAWASFRTIGAIAGIFLIFMVVNAKFWGDLWTYSFVPEQTAVIGLGLTIFGFGGVLERLLEKQPSRADGWFLLLTVGTLVSEGSKENFVILVPLFVLVFVLALWRRMLSSITIVLGLLSLLLTTAIGYAIIVPNAGRPTDFYGLDNSISHRLDVLLSSQQMLVIAPTILIAALAGLWSLRPWRRNRVDAPKICVAAGLAFGAAVYLSWEIFFYNGRIPSGIRYDFPSELLYPLILAVILYLGMLTLQRNVRSSALGLRLVVHGLVISAFVVGGYIVGEGFLYVVSLVRHSNMRSQAMMSDLNETRQLSSAHPDWPIIFIPTIPWDYEPTLTAPIWFRKSHIVNRMAVMVKVDPADAKFSFEQQLVEKMKGWSEKGVSGRFDTTLADVSSAMAQSHCFEVAFRETSAHCVPLPYNPNKYLPIE